MKRLIILFILILILLLLNSCGGTVNGKNLCKNGSFEELSDSNIIKEWTTSAWINTPEARLFASSEEAFEGDRSAQIVNYFENHSSYVQTIPVKENSKYEITAYIKTQNIRLDRNGASLDVATVLNAVGNLHGDNDWTKVGMNLTTQKGIASIQIILSVGYFGSLNTGTAWFDQVTVTQVAQFSNKYPAAEIRKQEVKPEEPPKEPVNETIASKVKHTLDIFSIFAGLIIFLGTAFYMIFVIHNEKEENIQLNSVESETPEITENSEPQEPIL